jgi:hypothetical protein
MVSWGVIGDTIILVLACLTAAMMVTGMCSAIYCMSASVVNPKPSR